MSWCWIGADIVLAIHDEQIAEHGGASGVRDQGSLESALARPSNQLGYGAPDIADLAAAYAYGIVRNHPFIDGNKRTAYVVMRLFLVANGRDLKADPLEKVTTMLRLAEGTMAEASFADWIRSRLDS